MSRVEYRNEHGAVTDNGATAAQWEEDGLYVDRREARDAPWMPHSYAGVESVTGQRMVWHEAVMADAKAAAAEAFRDTLTLPNPCPREGDVSIDRAEVESMVPRLMRMDYRLQEAAIKAFEENPGASKIFFLVGLEDAEPDPLAAGARVAPDRTLSVTLSEYDAGRMNALVDHFYRTSPDVPPPSPALILRMALDELHRLRVGQAPSLGPYRRPLARPESADEPKRLCWMCPYADED